MFSEGVDDVATHPLVMSMATVTDSSVGSRKSRNGIRSVTALMKACQICAGNEPPVTREMRTVGYTIEIWPLGKPTHTAPDSWGMNPANHASRHSCAVPVLPAAGRPMFAAVPVPYRITLRMIWVACQATQEFRTCFGLGFASNNTSPSGSSIRRIAVGRTYRPPVASVPKAEAISIVLTSLEPRTEEQNGRRGDRIPIRCATSTTRSGWTSRMIWAYTTLTLLIRPCSTVMAPPYEEPS